ncbi:restriction endonuclease [Lysobacter sp. S4-A87]|uniref:restriction endonuclease n=1 Tax=Lysobacter sp. S4-A87 TaxID=2925843 RepID=UPI001F535568|nr:restriction endonuclease [Lysobacter sp. S4-A87]UNK49675.1 restriction endonuclease [Lysobacter sp. S4-A87]
MLAGFSPLIATVVVVLSGALATAYLWLVRQRQAETTAGIEALAAMRWREFSRLVIEALHARGFVAESVEQTLEHGPQAEIRLVREGRTWLLACKQAGARSRLGAASVRELIEAVRFNGAAGGILATPARIEADARKLAGELDLYDGTALWALVSQMLPSSLREDLTANARKRSVREIAIAWGGALLLGLIAGFVPGLMQREPGTEAAVDSAPASAPAAPASSPAAPVADPALTSAAPADPNREQFERGEVIRAVSALPWVERVMWSTASTLVIQQREDVSQMHVQEVCAVLNRYDFLRASRLQLQPPAGSERTVRFLQCRSY